MTRSSFFALAFLTAAVVVGSLTVTANPRGGEGEPSIENSLAVQRAVVQARDFLYSPSAEPKKAVEVLEANLGKINGDRKYLALLRDAYRAYIKELTNQPLLADVYQKRLKILEDSDGLQQPVLAQQTPGAQQTPVKADQLPVSPVAATATKPRSDPFDQANEIKLVAAASPEKQNIAKTLLAKADDEFKQKRYAVAKELYEQANQADAKILGDDGRGRWAYCQLTVVVEQMNRFPEQPCDWTKLEKDVKNAVGVAPHLASAGDNILGNMAKRRDAAPAQTARGSMKMAVKHLPRNTSGWLVAETANFRVFHNFTEDYAENVIQTAEQTRSQMSRKWFGKEGEDWSPKCDIFLHASAADYSQRTGQNGASPGHSTINMDGSSGRIVVRKIDLRCDNTSMLDAILPHETTHVVLAGQFGNKHVPRWADEGIAVLTEPNEKVQQHRKNLGKALQSRDLIPLSSLLQMDNYPAPEKISTFYAQSVALVDFLAKQKGPVVLTQFIREGLQGGYEPALRKHYGFQSISELQDRFTERMLAEMNGTQPGIAGRQ
ncbi:MAG TPA: hypothetical protein VE988_11135 [Gemmataceae bacterium]|nr:hypothetical protein [Gemmataceae bacterium]